MHISWLNKKVTYHARHKPLRYALVIVCAFLSISSVNCYAKHLQSALPKLPEPAASSPVTLQRINLLNAYRRALAFDPSYQKTLATNAESDDQFGIERAKLLLSITGRAGITESYNLSTNERPSYSDDISLNANQTIFDWSNWQGLSASRLNQRAAAMDSAAMLQDLMQRVASSYFTVSLDQKQLDLDQHEIENDLQLLKEVSAEYHAGKKYRVELDNARANVAKMRATILLHKTQLVTDRNTLASMIGPAQIRVNSLNAIPYFPLKTRHLDDWLSNTQRHNLNILSAQYAQRSAKKDLSGAYAGFMPAISANANYNMGRDTEDNGVLGAASHEASIGLAADWTLFAGGKNYYSVHQQSHAYAAALQQTRLEEQKYITQCRTAFTRTINDELQIKLNQRAAILKKQVFEHTTEIYRQGVEQYTIDQVITAEEAYYAAEYSLLQSEYDYLNAIILLRQADGSLNYSTISKINTWLN